MQEDDKKKMSIYYTSRVLQGVEQIYEMIKKIGIITGELSKKVEYTFPKPRRKIKDASSKKENEWSRHQHLFEKNVRKTKKRFVNFEKKGSGVVYA